MHPSPAPTTSPLRHAVQRPLRLSALFLLVLTAAAACGTRPTAQTTKGPTPIPSHSDMVCLPPAHTSSAGGCVVQDKATGVSLRVANAYADATSTVVQLETSNTAGFPLTIWNSQIALPSDPAFLCAAGDTYGPTGLGVCEPLPPQDFAPQVHFVAAAHFRLPNYNGGYAPTAPPAPSWLKDLDRIAVSVPFALAPTRSGVYIYHQAPVVKQGIGVQVEWLQVSPEHTAFYGVAGGASIELLFSGLPANMEILSFGRLAARNSIGMSGDGWQGDVGPGLVDLQIPGLTVSTPALTALQNPRWPQGPGSTSVEPTVGAAGTAQVVVSYQGSGVPTG
ncbi:MAG TPA: hypothetical protein VJN88_02815, partial [Ktedonobacterales bacterium]|nr:hypothetical protein [Ktedonobacterales bacterium]